MLSASVRGPIDRHSGGFGGDGTDDSRPRDSASLRLIQLLAMAGDTGDRYDAGMYWFKECVGAGTLRGDLTDGHVYFIRRPDRGDGDIRGERCRRLTAALASDNDIAGRDHQWPR